MAVFRPRQLDALSSVTSPGAIDADDQAPALGRERRGQDRQAERHDGGCSEALHRPGRDEVREVRGQRAESRGDGEQQQPEVEDGTSPEPVTERRGRYDAGRERDAVGVDGPLQRGHGGMQVVLHVGQRADDDQGVEHYHEVGRRRQAQHPAEPIAAACVRRCACVHRPCLHSSGRICGNLREVTNGGSPDGQPLPKFSPGRVRSPTPGSSRSRSATDPTTGAPCSTPC